jgi:hypothetical protein
VAVAGFTVVEASPTRNHSIAPRADHHQHLQSSAASRWQIVLCAHRHSS